MLTPPKRCSHGITWDAACARCGRVMPGVTIHEHPEMAALQQQLDAAHDKIKELEKKLTTTVVVHQAKTNKYPDTANIVVDGKTYDLQFDFSKPVDSILVSHNNKTLDHIPNELKQALLEKMMVGFSKPIKAKSPATFTMTLDGIDKDSLYKTLYGADLSDLPTKKIYTALEAEALSKSFVLPKLACDTGPVAKALKEFSCAFQKPHLAGTVEDFDYYPDTQQWTLYLNILLPADTAGLSDFFLKSGFKYETHLASSFETKFASMAATVVIPAAILKDEQCIKVLFDQGCFVFGSCLFKLSPTALKSLSALDVWLEQDLMTDDYRVTVVSKWAWGGPDQHSVHSISLPFLNNFSPVQVPLLYMGDTLDIDPCYFTALKKGQKIKVYEKWMGKAGHHLPLTKS